MTNEPQHDPERRSADDLFRELCASSGRSFDRLEDFHLQHVSRRQEGESIRPEPVYLYTPFLNTLTDDLERDMLLQVLDERRRQAFEAIARSLAEEEISSSEGLEQHPEWVQAVNALDFSMPAQKVALMGRLLEVQADIYDQFEAWDVAILRFKASLLTGYVEVHPSNAEFIAEAEELRNDAQMTATIEAARRTREPEEENLSQGEISGVILSKLWKAMSTARLGVSAQAFAELTGKPTAVINNHYVRSMNRSNETYRALLVALIELAPAEDREWLEQNIRGIEPR